MREPQPASNDVFQRVNMYLDGRMTNSELTSFREDISHNPAVNEALTHEQSFRDLLKNSANRRRVSSDMIQSIKDKIRTPPH